MSITFVAIILIFLLILTSYFGIYFSRKKKIFKRYFFHKKYFGINRYFNNHCIHYSIKTRARYTLLNWFCFRFCFTIAISYGSLRNNYYENIF